MEGAGTLCRLLKAVIAMDKCEHCQKVQEFVNKRAEDEELWYEASFPREDYLQRGLRDLSFGY